MNLAPYRVAVANLLHDANSSWIGQLACRTQLDLLQLDYDWPTSGLACPTASADKWASYASAFVPLLATLQRPLYLTSELRLITNAGAGDPLRCAEEASHCLCEHGNRRVPLTAIRGTDILAQLEELIAAGASLSNLQTAAPLETVRQPIRRAQVEVGAGPIATALAEGARLVIAGAYCPSAPLIAASRQHFGWSWDDLNNLAGALVTARLARLGPVEMEADSSSRLLVPDSQWPAPRQADPQALRDALVDDGRFASIHTDVACDLSHLQFESTASGEIHVSGARGRTAHCTNHWPVTLWYQSHYTTRALLEISQSRVRELVASLHPLPGDALREHGPEGLSVERLIPLDVSPANSPSVGVDTGSQEIVSLQVTWQSPDRASCKQWSQQLTAWVGRQPELHVRLLEPWPEVRWQWAPWHTQIPRELITLAVDTRLAEDWVDRH